MEVLYDSNNKLNIIMKDKDIVNISTSRIGNKSQIKCIKGTLHFDTIPTQEIRALKKERKAIKAMDRYLKKSK